MGVTTTLRKPVAHSAPKVGDEETEAVARVLRSMHLAQGREVEAFEEECAAFLGRRYAVALSSGTAALHLALAALEAEEVALPTYACAALLSAIGSQQAKPVLCDIGSDFMIDCAAIPDTCPVAIVPHLLGGRATLPSACQSIEDIAQSFDGATGRDTIASVTSFYATKLMTTGEGGMVFTDDPAFAQFVREHRAYDNRDDCSPRFNYKMTDMQAAMGRVQLRRLPEFLAYRQGIARRYSEAFAGLRIGLPIVKDHVYFRYAIMTDRRVALERHLQKAGIEAKRPVYCPAHLLGVQRNGTLFPHADKAHLQALSLPIYPSMIESDVTHVIDSVCRFFD